MEENLSRLWKEKKNSQVMMRNHMTIWPSQLLNAAMASIDDKRRDQIIQQLQMGFQ